VRDAHLRGGRERRRGRVHPQLRAWNGLPSGVVLQRRHTEGRRGVLSRGTHAVRRRRTLRPALTRARGSR